MKWKNILSDHITITCTSFTIITLLFTILSNVGIVDEVTGEVIYKLFIVCFSVSSAIYITSLIHIDSVILTCIVNFIDVVAMVFIVGGVILKVFSFTWPDILIALGMLSLAYFGTLALFFLKENITAGHINREISEFHKKNGSDERGE